MEHRFIFMLGNKMNIEQAAQTLKTTCRILSELDDLSPANPKVNDTLGHMVCQVCKWQTLGYGQCLLSQQDLQDVRGALPQLCARAEGEMERHWADYFMQQPHLDESVLRHFWYYDNYLDVVEAELALMGDVLGSTRGFSFVGAGPLPMTVLVAALRLPESHFECVDWDAAACAQAQELVNRLGLASRIQVIHARAQDYIPPADMLPIVASLIEGKPEVYKAYQQAGVSAFMVRDAEDVYEFIYRPAERPDGAWHEAGKTPLCASRLNTTRLYVQKESCHAV